MASRVESGGVQTARTWTAYFCFSRPARAIREGMESRDGGFANSHGGQTRANRGHMEMRQWQDLYALRLQDSPDCGIWLAHTFIDIASPSLH